MCRMVPYTNGGLVAEIKLPHIKNISEQAQKAKGISRIMLFGSSLDERCTQNSDIDIAVFGTKTKERYIDSKEFRDFKSNLFQFDWDQDYDVLYFKDGGDYQDPIMTDINRGVEVFRRVAE
ncbi:MAG: nucleotidyltransferase domain-containing protein [Lachnospiraceae bacterium]|nr:nucleotidyltransferase domain-containing protein [Lachnospiraceae bacterium]